MFLCPYTVPDSITGTVRLDRDSLSKHPFYPKGKCYFNNSNYLHNNLTVIFKPVQPGFCPVLLLIFGASCDLLPTPWEKENTLLKLIASLRCQVLLPLSGFLATVKHFQFSPVCHSLSKALCMWDSVFKKKWVRAAVWCTTSIGFFELYQLFWPTAAADSALVVTQYTWSLYLEKCAFNKNLGVWVLTANP